MKKAMLVITLAVALAALAGMPAWAQGVYGAVKGKVTGDAGPMAGVKLDYKNTDTGSKYSVTTDKNGEFFSLGLIPGPYTVTLSKDGQTIWTQEGVRVSLGEPNEHNFNLPELRAAAMTKPGQPVITPEQLKKIEEAQKETATLKNLNDLMASAQTAEDAKMWDQAIAILNQAAVAGAARHEVWGKMCEVELGAGKLPDAEEHCKKAITLAEAQTSVSKSQLAAYHNDLGQVYVKDGKTQEAMAQYTSAAQTDPTNAAKFYFNLGAIFTNSFKTDEAIQAFDKAIAADPTYAEAYYWKATNMINKATTAKDPKTGKDRMVAPPGTAEAYQKYLELSPDGRFAQAAKDVLTMIGSEVQTSYGKPRKTK